jgi:hypothetical protein
MALMSKKSLRLMIVAAVIGAAGFFGYQYWQQMKSNLPKGIASGNGRIEAKLVDVAAKEALRVKEIRVEEGALVHPGEVLVVLDTATLESLVLWLRRYPLTSAWREDSEYFYALSPPCKPIVTRSIDRDCLFAGHCALG